MYIIKNTSSGFSCCWTCVCNCAKVKMVQCKLSSTAWSLKLKKATGELLDYKQYRFFNNHEIEILM
jgi:hypothetical protein